MFAKSFNLNKYKKILVDSLRKIVLAREKWSN